MNANMNTFVSIDNIKCLYTKNGAGDKTLILLHGWGQSHAFWQDFIVKLERKYTIYSLDLPGWGVSQEPPFAWDINDYADFIAAFIKHFKIKDPFIVGHSFGGKVAIAYAAKYHLKKIILYSSSGVPSNSIKKRLHLQTINILKHVTPNMIYRLHSVLFRPKAYRNNILVNRNRSRRMLDIYTSNSKKIELSLKGITSDVLLLYGENDYIVPLRVAHALNAILPHPQLVLFPRATHFAHIEESEDFYKVLTNFIDKD